MAKSDSPKAAQVVDTFHVISPVNRYLDAVRRRVQTEQLGHRGRRDDWLYRTQRVLLIGEEKLDDDATSACGHFSHSAIQVPRSPLPIRVKERLREFHRTGDPDEARRVLEELKIHLRRTLD